MTDAGNDNEEALAGRLEELKSALEEEEFEQAVGLCESLLKDEAYLPVSTTDETDNSSGPSLHAMIYESYVKSLLQRNEFEKVLELAPPNKECRLVWEPLQVYAMYRLEQYDRVLQTVDKLLGKNSNNSTNDALLEHIKAQSLFHTSDTVHALAAFDGMIQTNSDKEELLLEATTNAIAAMAANATPYDDDERRYPTALSQNRIEQALDLVANQDGTEEYPYDLAYNIATFQLLKADTAARRQTATCLLQQAQRNAANNGMSTAELERELQPLRLNAHWGRIFWGEDAPSTASSKKPASNNLNGILEQINPILLQDTANAKAGDKTIGLLESLLTSTNFKLSALQKRLVRYNMAILQLRAQRYGDCQTTLEALHQSLSLNKKKNKKKIEGGMPIIPTVSDGDALWWQVRIEVLQAYSYKYQIDANNKSNENGNSKMEKSLQDVIQRLQTRQEKIQTMLTAGASEASSSFADEKLLEHSMLYLQLHLKELTDDFSSSLEHQFQWLQTTCDTKQYPAIIASLAKQYQDRNLQDKAKEILLTLNKGNNNNSSHIVAEMAMAQENFQEAVTLYEQALETDPQNHSLRARLVEALSHVDPKRAAEEWKRIEAADPGVGDDDDDDEEVEDAEALEKTELPRIKSAASALVGVDNNGDAVGPSTSSNKKSKDAILRQRAKQRAAYLEKLEQKGLYNSSRPTLPDPERWIPKHERQRRRRRGGNQSKASQGGVSAKDAAKLDVAARASGAVDTGTSARSTAHMSVAGDGRKGGGRRR